ncbi:bifunctional diguanylate cyclase/phosphodiesterase [Chthonobacter albigriseus]|uniref:bifunctional diguanylate cyclase/phosphodiesterase n=1 Tax=Chthonobacter albigriseus TaxID=1683161 RepID=UPI0015EF04F8|nr:EAL domain-containing protein [Chthonobacter albigriseus]
MARPVSSVFSSLRMTLSRTRGIANVPALLALMVIVLLGFFADYQNRVLFEQRLRSDVLQQVSLIRAKLEGEISSSIQLVRGLVATLATEPQMSQQRFSELAESLFAERSLLRNVAAAPNLVVRLIHPLQGNEKAIGLDYRRSPTQRDAALRARSSGELVLAGPVDLVQGGQGLIGRYPVYTREAFGGRTFWGIVSAVLELERLYQASGLRDPDLPLDIAIVGKDALGADGVRFFGTDDIAARDPITAEVVLPSGRWLIQAVPKGGWDVTPDGAWLLRFLIAVAGALVVVPTFLAGRLLTERQAHVSELHRRESELARISRRLKLALDTSEVGVWEMDIVTEDLAWDDRMNELYGYPTDGGERWYEHWSSRLHPDDLDRASADFRQAFSSGSYHSEYRLFLPDGSIRHIRAIGSVYEEPGRNARIVGVNWDVTADVELADTLRRTQALTEARNAELEAAKARIEYTSLHDFLTGLPNRRYLDDLLERVARRCARTGESASLLHIDLDRFKQINDTLGHAAGDAILVEASRLMRAIARPEDFVARIGGDEFVVVCVHDAKPSPAQSLAERLVEAMRQPFRYENSLCRTGVSIGIAEAKGAAVGRSRLMVDADIALYRAKSLGRDCFAVFTEALQAEIVTSKRIADEILAGLEEHQFVPYYQIQVDARTLELAGVEALVRWRHPTEGVLSPDRFLQIAEEINAVGAIDRLMLEAVLKDRSRWIAAGYTVPRISVNVSARRLHDDALIQHLRSLDIRPGSIGFELVESIYLDESDDIVTWNLDQIKDLGIEVEIDDFGSGYASMISLMKLKPHRLKIDKQLVLPVLQSSAQRQLLQSIVEIGRALGIGVVAEGVETMEHARLLAEIGCDYLQGYAFSKPVSARDLVPLLAASDRPLKKPAGF